MKIEFVVVNNFKTDNIEQREAELTRIVERLINRTAEQEMLKNAN